MSVSREEIDRLINNVPLDEKNIEELRHKWKAFINQSPQCPLQDTTELLEALEELKMEATTLYEIMVYSPERMIKSRVQRYEEKVFKLLNKLHKALGGKVNE